MIKYINNNNFVMKSVAGFIKKYWKTFNDSLINPPKPTLDKKNFKGQNIPKKNIWSRSRSNT